MSTQVPNLFDVYRQTIKHNRMYHLVAVLFFVAALTLVIWAVSKTQYVEALSTFAVAFLAFFATRSFQGLGGAASRWSATLRPLAAWRDEVSKEWSANLRERNILKLAIAAIAYGIAFVAVKGVVVGIVSRMDDWRYIVALGLVIAVPLIAPELLLNAFEAMARRNELKREAVSEVVESSTTSEAPVSTGSHRADSEDPEEVLVSTYDDHPERE